MFLLLSRLFVHFRSFDDLIVWYLHFLLTAFLFLFFGIFYAFIFILILNYRK